MSVRTTHVSTERYRFVQHTLARVIPEEASASTVCQEKCAKRAINYNRESIECFSTWTTMSEPKELE